MSVNINSISPEFIIDGWRDSQDIRNDTSLDAGEKRLEGHKRATQLRSELSINLNDQEEVQKSVKAGSSLEQRMNSLVDQSDLSLIKNLNDSLDDMSISQRSSTMLAELLKREAGSYELKATQTNPDGTIMRAYQDKDGNLLNITESYDAKGDQTLFNLQRQDGTAAQISYIGVNANIGATIQEFGSLDDNGRRTISALGENSFGFGVQTLKDDGTSTMDYTGHDGNRYVSTVYPDGSIVNVMSKGSEVNIYLGNVYGTTNETLTSKDGFTSKNTSYVQWDAQGNFTGYAAVQDTEFAESYGTLANKDTISSQIASMLREKGILQSEINRLDSEGKDNTSAFRAKLSEADLLDEDITELITLLMNP